MTTNLESQLLRLIQRQNSILVQLDQNNKLLRKAKNANAESQKRTYLTVLEKLLDEFDGLMSQSYEIFNLNKIITVSDSNVIDELKKLHDKCRDYMGEERLQDWDDYSHTFINDYFRKQKTKDDDELIQSKNNGSIRVGSILLTSKIPSIIVSNEIPNQFHRLFSDLISNFRNESYNAVCYDCRTIIEIGLKMKLEEFNDPDYKKLKNQRRIRIEWLIDRCRELHLIDNKSRDMADYIRRLANKLLHEGFGIGAELVSNNKNNPQENTLILIRNTFYIVEYLFGKPDKRTRLHSVKT